MLGCEPRPSLQSPLPQCLLLVRCLLPPTVAHSTLTTATGKSHGHNNADEQSEVPKGWVENPMKKLYQQLNSGQLGDQSLPFHLLISAFRRKKLLAGSTGPPGSEEQLYVGTMTSVSLGVMRDTRFAVV